MTDLILTKTIPSLWDRYLDFLVHCFTCTTHVLVVHNKFLAPLLRKVWFGVWIDMLAKEKLAKLRKKFLLFFFFFFLDE